jgi:hypothetical protein
MFHLAHSRLTGTTSQSFVIGQFQVAIGTRLPFKESVEVSGCIVAP